MRPRIALPILLMAATVAACSDSPPSASDTTPPPGSDAGRGAGGGGGSGDRLRLTRFSDCDAFLDHVRAEAAERVGPYGFDVGGSWDMPVFADDRDFAVPATQAPVATVAPDMPLWGAEGSDDSADVTYTGTNVQETGVDEADLVKTDGARIVAIADGTLHVVDPTLPGAAVSGSLRVGHEVAEMMLVGDRVVLFALDWDRRTGQPSLELVEVSIADPNEPTEVASVTIDGTYLSARLIGDRLRVAVSSAPDQIPFVLPGSPAGEQLAEDTNRQAVLDSTLADWTPEFELTVDGDEVASGPLTDCAGLHRPGVFSGFDLLNVIDVDLGADAGVSALAAAFDVAGAPSGTVGVLGGGSTVYSSQSRMYVATTRWHDPADATQDRTSDVTTAVHAFSIDAAEPTRYVASGEVDGTLLSQFSLDEHEGNLRVVVTDTDANGTTETRLVVLAEQGDLLEQIGAVGGLGVGERLYSVRLMGDIGFAVTFRQIDPFYVLDLRDPTAPTIAGELKLPGMSTYLHPLGDLAETGLVVGVGQDATETGMTTGLKVSVFDVSDPANPTEAGKWVMPGGSSVAEYDHRAFQVAGNTVFIPIAYPSPSAQLLTVADDGTVTEAGTIEHLLVGLETHSDCEVLPLDVLGGEASPLYWEQLGGARVQLCGPNDAGGWDGTTMNCVIREAAELAYLYASPEDHAAAVDQMGLGDADRIESCYPSNYFPSIQRTFVIDDAIWTFSPARLQANARGGLGLLAVVELW